MSTKIANVYDKKDLIIVFLIYIIILVKSLYASQLGFGFIDEGEYLHIGLRILRGDIPYRDFFSYLPFLYDYWNAFAFKLFGVSVFSPKLLNSIVFSFVPVLYYLIARRFSSPAIALVISLSFGFMEFGMERLYYHIFTFSSLVCYFIFQKNEKKEVGFLVGLLLGISALFRLDVGLQFFFGLITATVLYHMNNSSKWFYIAIKQLLIIGLGFSVPIFGFIYWLIIHNTLVSFIQSSILTPSAFASSQNLPFPKLWDIFPKHFSPQEAFASYEAFFIYLIFTIYLYALYYINRNWKNIWKNTPELPTFLIIAVFTTPYIFSRPDLGHMVKGGIPAFFIAAFILEKHRASFTKYLLIIPTILIFIGIAQAVWWTNFFDTTIQTPNGKIITNSKIVKGASFVSANTIERSLDFINKNTLPGEQILAIPHMSGLYFLSNRPSKSYVGNIYYSYLPNEEKFIEELKNLNVKVVIYDFASKPPGYIQELQDYYPKIDRYVRDNFRIVEESPEGWLYMIRR